METKTKSSRKNPTVLIVDDDETLRYSLGRIVKIAGFNVLEASSGQEATVILSCSEPDVVVSDIVLPDFDGFELCRRMKAEKSTQKTPIILVTSMYYRTDRPQPDLENGRIQAKRLGAAELMPRGETIDQLLPLLKRLLGKKSRGMGSKGPVKATTSRT